MAEVQIAGESFNVEDGIIKDLGKFQGCPDYAPHFWSLWLQGSWDEEHYDEDENLITIFRPDEEDVEQFPSLQGVKKIELWEDDQGFVHVSTS